MKTSMKYAVVIGLLITVTACTREFDLDTERMDPKIVIEGRISSLQGPYLVRITKSTNQLSFGTIPGVGIDSPDVVKDALVIISDDTGVRDTLIRPESVSLQRYVYHYNFPQNRYDSGLTNFVSSHYTSDRGYYRTTKIKGIPGHTYHLEVQIDNQKFEASAFMPPVPALESVALKDTIVDQFGTRAWLPLAWFREPQNEKNFYRLWSRASIDGYPYDYSNDYYDSHLFFRYCLVDDKMLPQFVNGLAVRVPVSSRYPFEPGGVYEPVLDSITQQAYQIKLGSLTKEAYNYFSQLIAQFNDDGNIYKPTPATAKGNISGGALGIFYATDVSTKVLLPR